MLQAQVKFIFTHSGKKDLLTVLICQLAMKDNENVSIVILFLYNFSCDTMTSALKPNVGGNIDDDN